MLSQAVKVYADHPAIGPEGWWDVIGYALLDERDQAIAALERGVAEGRFLDLGNLDDDPLMADLRADPRYEKIVAPARARAAAQVKAAQDAGLL